MSLIDATKVNPAEVAHGFMFIGLLLNILLLGVMISQVYIYATTYKRDKIWIKIFVAGLFILDCLNTAFDVAYLYKVLIVKFGDVQYLSTANWLFALDPATTAIIGMTVQLFFAKRIYTLTENRILFALMCAIALLCASTSIVVAFQVVQVGQFTRFREIKAMVTTALLSAAVNDAFITLTLIFHLYRNRKTGFGQSDMIVDRIVRFTVQTGFITMIFAILNLVFYLADPSGIHLLFNFPIAKLYSNSVMSSLNSRKGWKYQNTFDQYESAFEAGIQGVASRNGKMLSPHEAVGTNKGSAMHLDHLGPSSPGVIVHVESHVEVLDEGSSEKDSGKRPWDSPI